MTDGGVSGERWGCDRYDRGDEGGSSSWKKENSSNCRKQYMAYSTGYLHGEKLTIIHKYLHVRCSV